MTYITYCDSFEFINFNSSLFKADNVLSVKRVVISLWHQLLQAMIKTIKKLLLKLTLQIMMVSYEKLNFLHIY